MQNWQPYESWCVSFAFTDIFEDSIALLLRHRGHRYGSFILTYTDIMKDGSLPS